MNLLSFHIALGHRGELLRQAANFRLTHPTPRANSDAEQARAPRAAEAAASCPVQLSMRRFQ